MGWLAGWLAGWLVGWLVVSRAQVAGFCADAGQPPQTDASHWGLLRASLLGLLWGSWGVVWGGGVSLKFLEVSWG